MPALLGAFCHGNALTTLDLAPVPDLQLLVCGDNRLAALDLTPVPHLRVLSCTGNPLTSLDLAPVPDLVLLERAGQRPPPGARPADPVPPAGGPAAPDCLP